MLGTCTQSGAKKLGDGAGRREIHLPCLGEWGLLLSPRLVAPKHQEGLPSLSFSWCSLSREEKYLLSALSEQADGPSLGCGSGSERQQWIAPLQGTCQSCCFSPRLLCWRLPWVALAHAQCPVARWCCGAKGSPGLPEVPGLKPQKKGPISAPRAMPWAASSFFLVMTAEEKERKRARTEAVACLSISQPRCPMFSVFLALSCLPRRLAQLLELGLSFHTSPVLGLALSEIGDVSHELDLSPEGWTLMWTWTPQPSGLSPDSSRVPAAPAGASGARADAVWQSSGEEFGWLP